MADRHLIHFTPVFEDYTLKKGQFLLFGNGIFIDPERYELIDNGTIELTDERDFNHYIDVGYTMVILNEIETKELYGTSAGENAQYIWKIETVEATEEEQRVFTVPNVGLEDPQFFVFVGSVFMNMKDQVSYIKTTNQITFNDPDYFVAKGRKVYFVFLNPNVITGSGMTKYLELMPIHFEVDDNGRIFIPEYLANGIVFEKENLIVFVNGILLQQDRFDFLGNEFFMLQPDTDMEMQPGKALSAYYLKRSKAILNSDDVEGPYSYVDMLEDNDYVWFDEMYATPYETPEEHDFEMDLLTGSLEFSLGNSYNYREDLLTGSCEFVIETKYEADTLGTVDLVFTDGYLYDMESGFIVQVEYSIIYPDDDTHITLNNEFDMKDTNNLHIMVSKDTTDIDTVELDNNSYPISIFEGNDIMCSLTFEEGCLIKTIQPYTFHNCSSLAGVFLHDGLEYIGSNAFDGSMKLKSITIPSSVIEIEEEAFSGTNVSDITFMGNTRIHYSSFPVTNDEFKIHYNPSNANYQFDNMPSVRDQASISIKPEITEILPYQYRMFKNIQSVAIPISVKKIGVCAFDSCTSLIGVAMFNGLEVIDEGAFFNCSKLETINMPNTVKELGTRAFDGCTSLRSINFSGGISRLESNTFVDCNVLDTINLNEGLSTIGNNCITSTSLKKLTIPSSVTYIDSQAFRGLSGLTEIVVNKPPRSLDGAPWGAPNAEVRFIRQTT